MTTTTTTPVTTDEAFYLERFKECLKQRNYVNGRIVDEDYFCEIYKGFAIVTMKQERTLPYNKGTRIEYWNYVWEVGGIYDNLKHLSWLSQGNVTAGFSADTLEKSLKKVKKKLDLLHLVYSKKSELQTLSNQYQGRKAHNTPSIFNASLNDVVGIQAFGRTRLGIVVATQGSRFVVAYMTPSNPNDCHYKILPLSRLYPKD